MFAQLCSLGLGTGPTEGLHKKLHGITCQWRGVSRLPAGFLGLFSVHWGNPLAAFTGAPPELQLLAWRLKR